MVVFPVFFYRSDKSIDKRIDHSQLRNDQTSDYCSDGEFFISRQLNQKQAKEEIAEYAAANTVENGDTIFLGNGTTVQYFSIALAKQLATGKLRNIQIFTNSFTNVSLLHPYSDIMLIGGQYRNNWQDFIGYLPDHLLKSISFKKCFIGTDGIHLDDGGIYAEDMATARIDELVLRRNEKSFLLADSTKLNRRSLIRYGSIQDIYDYHGQHCK